MRDQNPLDDRHPSLMILTQYLKFLAIAINDCVQIMAATSSAF